MHLLQVWLNLVYTQPGPVVEILSEQMNPVTQEQRDKDVDYLLTYLAREAIALGPKHPQLTCDALAISQEVASWEVESGDIARELLHFAVSGQGKCAEIAAIQYFQTLR